MKAIIEILKNYKLVKKEYFWMIVTGILFQWVHFLYPKITQHLISIVETRWELSDLYFWVLVLSLQTVLYLIARIAYDYFSVNVWLKLFARKQLKYQRDVLDKNYKDIQDLWTWKLITRLESWVQWEVEVFSSVTNIFLEVVLGGTVVIIILFFHIPKLVLLVFLGIAVLLVTNFYLRKYVKKYTKKEQEYWEEFGRVRTRTVMENLTIKLFRKKDIELSKSKRILEWASNCWVKVDVAHGFYYKTIEWVIRFLEIWFFIVLWALIIREGNYWVSYLVMVIWYVWFLWWPLDRAITNLNRISRMWEKYIKLKKFFNLPDEIKDWKEKYNYKKWKIEFKNIRFSYSKWKEIFSDFNLEFLEWKKNALVWHSWGWKSTITKILLRLYDYQGWEVLVDGQDLKTLQMDSFYKHIGYLSQDPAVFDGTIRENLEYALPDNHEYDDEIIWKALKKAQIDEMIKWLEKGLETEVWEKWIKLSGWEKQRLAIARVFLKNPEIVILDEPTSALDSFSEELITEAMHKLFKWRTVIIIAHRLQTVKEADSIFVIEKWEIKEKGTHKELVKEKGIYKKMLDLQSGREFISE